MTRATAPAPCARIDLDALRHNLTRARAAAPGRRVIAVIKADGYGHGMLRVARALADADAFAVARLDETLALRAAGIDKRILLLPGVAGGEELERAAAARIDLAVHHISQIEAIESARLSSPISAWLKVDSGMHRLGFAPHRVAAAYARLADCAALAAAPRLMTHFAEADDRAGDATPRQLAVFAACTAGLAVERSLANSAAVLGWPAAHGDWLRPGLMLYGISPFVGGTAADHDLHPAMTLTTRLIAVNQVPAGGKVGYGGTWTCPEPMPVGAAAIGYGDGYLRHAEAGTPVLLNGRRVPLIGRVSMDTITLDLRGQPEARPGDPVVLWGRGLPVEEVACHMQTIPYELVTRVAARVHFIEETGRAPGI